MTCKYNTEKPTTNIKLQNRWSESPPSSYAKINENGYELTSREWSHTTQWELKQNGGGDQSHTYTNLCVFTQVVSTILWCLICSGLHASHWEMMNEEATVLVDMERAGQTHQGQYNLRTVHERMSQSVNAWKVTATPKTCTRGLGTRSVGFGEDRLHKRIPIFPFYRYWNVPGTEVHRQARKRALQVPGCNPEKGTVISGWCEDVRRQVVLKVSMQNNHLNCMVECRFPGHTFQGTGQIWGWGPGIRILTQVFCSAEWQCMAAISDVP